RGAVLVASVFLLVGTVYLFVTIPKGFIPSQDTGQLTGQVEAAQGIGFDSMVAHELAVADVVQKDPNVAALTHNVSNGNNGRLNIELKPRSDRTLSADEVIEELRPKLAAIPGVRVYLQNPPAIRIGGQQSRSLYQYTLQDPDTTELYRVYPQFEDKVRQLPGLTDVTSDLQITNPQVNVSLDRDRIAALGLTVDQVESALTSSYGTRQVSTIYAPNNEYQVIMQVAPQFQSDPNALSQVYLHATNGAVVPLSQVASIAPGVGPLQVNHTGQLPSV